VTLHANPHRTPDEALLIDIDLSILAAEPARFDAYEQAIRAEYARVPTFIYRAKRRRVLEKFLARERLYVTAACHDQFEASARANLARSIGALS
jgi:predicted metal-dependent HD superfamily phosphohydrolase